MQNIQKERWDGKKERVLGGQHDGKQKDILSEIYSAVVLSS